MQHRYVHILWLVCFLAAIGSSALAQNVEPEPKAPNIVWTKRPNRGSGLYTTRNYFVAPGVSISGFANYYYGDVDNVGVPFNGGFNVKNLNGGGSLSYQHPISNHCNLRVGLLAGALGGDNTKTLKETITNKDGTVKVRDDFKKFQSIVIQPFAGVQYYPFSQVGFYLYGGFGIAGSIITKYDFIRLEMKEPSTEHMTGSAFGILPMVQLGIGYSWMLSTSWSIGAEIMVQQGLCDEYSVNLDAYPLDGRYNGGESYGTGGLKNNGTPKWADGWFQVGITLTYQWRNCETCQIINNYQNIKPRKRR